MTKLFQNDCVRFGHRKYALDYLATIFNAGMNAPLCDETNVRMAGILEETFIVSRLPLSNPLSPPVQLSCEIGSKRIFSNLSVSMYRGRIYGVVGNNGSGKSTLISCLLNSF